MSYQALLLKEVVKGFNGIFNHSRLITEFTLFGDGTFEFALNLPYQGSGVVVHCLDCGRSR